MEDQKNEILKGITIGHVNNGITTLVTDHSHLDDVIAKVKRLKLDEKIRVVTIDQHIDNSVYIKGERYLPIDSPARNDRFDMEAATLIALGAMYGTGSCYSRPNPSVNILEEFKLIQDKKSKLSKRDREWVVSEFYKSYKLA